MKPDEARILLLVDLRDFFSSDLGTGEGGGGGGGGGRKINSENDQLTCHFQMTS